MRAFSLKLGEMRTPRLTDHGGPPAAPDHARWRTPGGAGGSQGPDA